MSAEVYRVRDKAGRLIYIGATQNFANRWMQHEQGTWWFGLVGSVTTEEYPTPEAARAAEAVAIQEEQPAFNVMATGRISGVATPEDVEFAERWRADGLAQGRGPSLPSWIFNHESWEAARTGARRRFYLDLAECVTDRQALDAVLQAVEEHVPLSAIREAINAWDDIRDEAVA